MDCVLVSFFCDADTDTDPDTDTDHDTDPNTDSNIETYTDTDPSFNENILSGQMTNHIKFKVRTKFQKNYL